MVPERMIFADRFDRKSEGKHDTEAFGVLGVE